MNQYNRQQHIPRDLKLYHYNVHRSKDVVVAQLLRDQEVISADIIAIQEPLENPFKDDTNHPLKQTHELLYPLAGGTGERARVCLFISKALGGYTYLAHSRDCQEVRIKTESTEELRLINIYNDQQRATALGLLQDILPPSVILHVA
jgi:hypothetical protein